VANGREAELQPWGGEIFRTTHPDFHAFNLMFERSGGAVTGAAWGSNSFAREGSARPLAASDPALARLAGRYINDSPWWGSAIIVERGGKLWIGTDSPLVRIADNLWRIGPESWLPERVSFAEFIDGRPQTMIFSGVRFDRHDI
jgi:hypothetical protein